MATLTKPNVYSDGGDLYLRIRTSGRSWIFIGTLHGQRIELGLGNALDVTLAKARERAADIRTMLIDGIDPRMERAKAKVKAKPAVTFGAFAMDLVEGIEEGFKNPKHRQQWRNTLKTYAQPLFEVPIHEVTTEQILVVLQPIWLSKPATFSCRTIDAAL